MLLRMLFAILYVVHLASLPVLYQYIFDYADPGFHVGNLEDDFLALLGLLLPGVALIWAYKVYKDCNRKKLGEEENGK